MKARELIQNAAFGPQDLDIVYRAFDEAWKSVDGNFGDDPVAIEAARTRLASVVLTVARNGITDAQALEEAALQAFALD
jgi:hypothetical protein